MSEERVIFRGNPSAVTILGAILFYLAILIAISVGLVVFYNKVQPNLRPFLFMLPFIPLLLLVGKCLMLQFLTYEITSERVKVTRGILSKRTDELELYRVRDTSLIEPFIYRMFSVGNILLTGIDASTPNLELKGLKNATNIREQLRASIEECRVRKRAGIVEIE